MTRQDWKNNTQDREMRKIGVRRIQEILTLLIRRDPGKWFCNLSNFVLKIGNFVFWWYKKSKFRCYLFLFLVRIPASNE